MGNREDYILCLPSNFSNLKVVHLMLFIMFTVNLNNPSTGERGCLRKLQCFWHTSVNGFNHLHKQLQRASRLTILGIIVGLICLRIGTFNRQWYLLLLRE